MSGPRVCRFSGFSLVKADRPIDWTFRIEGVRYLTGVNRALSSTAVSVHVNALRDFGFLRILQLLCHKALLRQLFRSQIWPEALIKLGLDGVCGVTLPRPVTDLLEQRVVDVGHANCVEMILLVWPRKALVECMQELLAIHSVQQHTALRRIEELFRLR